MKCRKCGADMRRQKVDNRKYRYVCPKCGSIIQNASDTKVNDEYEQAYNIVMGKADESR